MAAALGLAFFGVLESWIVVVGGYSRTPLPSALGLAAALGFLLRLGVLSCVVVEGDPRISFYATLGLAAALGLAFFGVRASWIVIVGGNPRIPLSNALGLTDASARPVRWCK
jgi:hypothetical protein